MNDSLQFSTHATADSSTTHEPFKGKPFNQYLRITLIVVGTGLLVCGILGNALLLLVMFKRRKVKRFRNVFIANLSLADLLVTSVVLPFFLLDLLLGRHPVVSDLHCM